MKLYAHCLDLDTQNIQNQIGDQAKATSAFKGTQRLTPTKGSLSMTPIKEEAKETLGQGFVSTNDASHLSANSHGENKAKSKKRNTLTRKDVMQKTIFRALRKEYAYFFNQFLLMNNYSMNYDSAEFKQYLTDFVRYISSWEAYQTTQIFGSLQNLPFIIGLMVDFCKVKKMDKTAEEKRLMDQFYDALYKYSHAKFDRLLEIPEAQFLFRKILGPEYIEVFISRYITLSKNRFEYKKCAEAIVSLIDSRSMRF